MAIAITSTVFKSPYTTYVAGQVGVGSGSNAPVSGTEGIGTNTIKNVVALSPAPVSGANTAIIVEYISGTARKRGTFWVNKTVAQVLTDINA